MARGLVLAVVCGAALLGAAAAQDIPSCLDDCSGIEDAAKGTTAEQCAFLLSKEDDDCWKDCSDDEVKEVAAFIEDECDSDGGIPSCLSDCSGIEDAAKGTIAEQCAYLISKEDDDCWKDCSDEDVEGITEFIEDECDGDGDTDAEDVPECLSDCPGLSAAVSGGPAAQCSFLMSVEKDKCVADCDDETMDELTEYVLSGCGGDGVEVPECLVDCEGLFEAAASGPAAQCLFLRSIENDKCSEDCSEATREEVTEYVLGGCGGSADEEEMEAAAEVALAEAEAELSSAKEAALKAAKISGDASKIEFILEALEAGADVEEIVVKLTAADADDACDKTCKGMGLSDCSTVVCSATASSKRRRLMQSEFTTNTFVNANEVDTAAAKSSLESEGFEAEVIEVDVEAEMVAAGIDKDTASQITTASEQKQSLSTTTFSGFSPASALSTLAAVLGAAVAVLAA